MPMSVYYQGDDDAAPPSTGRNEYGCRTLESIDLAKLDKNNSNNKVPFVIYFHGGGLTIGTRNNGEDTDLVRCVSLEAGKPVIVASVEYSLAPTYVFPAPVLESLTVLTYLMERMPQQKFHIAGMSAGGNLAVVSAFELFRRHPDKLASLAAWIPMLDPAANSESYYMNRSSAHVAPAEWLRWCWRCYLALPPNEKDKEVDIFSLNSMSQRYQHGSNETAWEASEWRKTQLDRLANPLLSVPSNFTVPSIVLTNQADTLHDDGFQLVQALRQIKGSNVKHLDHIGSHWLGTVTSPQNYRSMVQGWKSVLFP